MKKVINSLILLIYILELCCSYCLYQNLHKGNEVIPITDEEAIKKENINIKNKYKEFEKNIKSWKFKK